MAASVRVLDAAFCNVLCLFCIFRRLLFCRSKDRIKRRSIFSFDAERDIFVADDVDSIEYRLIHQTFDFVAGASVCRAAIIEHFERIEYNGYRWHDKEKSIHSTVLLTGLENHLIFLFLFRRRQYRS